MKGYCKLGTIHLRKLYQKKAARLLRQRKDIIEIRKKDPTIRCKRYDVVLYKWGDKYILHRVLKVRPSDYVICGDHNIWREYGITDAQILGIMTRVIRNGKAITTDNTWYKLYSHLWCDFFYIRVSILYFKKLFYMVLGKAKRFVKQIIK